MKKILLIEDDVINREMYSYWLKQHYEVTPAENATQAFQKIEQTKFDLYIADLMLPGISGKEFIERIREGNDTTPIIILTALKDPYYVKSLLPNINGYCLKGDDSTIVLLDTIERALSNLPPLWTKWVLKVQSMKLSLRESQIASMKKGFSAKEIGEQLYISYHTVNKTLDNVRKKYPELAC